jgi:hypothetical protein
MLGAEEAKSLDPLMMVEFKLNTFKCIHDQTVNRGWHCRVKAVPAVEKEHANRNVSKQCCF